MEISKDVKYLELDEREQGILSLADDLLGFIGEKKLDEAWLDSQFLFRFDPVWTRESEAIHKTLRAILGRSEDEPLAEADRVRFFMYLMNNFGFRPWEGPQPFSHQCYTLKTSEIYFPGDPEHPAHIQSEINESLKLLQQIQELAESFNLLPRHRKELDESFNLLPRHQKELDEWPPEDRERQFQAVVSWMIFDTGRPVPQRRVERHQRGSQITDHDTLLPWKVTKLEEFETGEGNERHIRPRAWDFLRDPGNPTRGKGRRMTLEVRTRTWAIYYLSQRGGGRRAVEAAVWIWNEIHPKPKLSSWRPRVPNFKKERKRLFLRGTLKKE